jgi:uncharacterized protein (UPF0333 family)
MDNLKVKAQVSIEFAITFVVLVLFVVLAAKMFAWMGSTIVNRHMAYENSRSMTSSGAAKDMVPPVDFFTTATGKKPLDVFNEIK